MNIEIQVDDELIVLVKKRRELMKTKPTPSNFSEEMKEICQKIAIDVALQLEWYIDRGDI